MVPLARRNLLAERARLAVSVSGVALAVLLILIVVALYRGWSESGATINEIPGDLWVVQRGTQDPFHSVSLLSQDLLEPLNAIGGVDKVTPVLARRMTFSTGERETSVYLMALGSVPADEFTPPKGTLVIDERFSKKSGLEEGDEVVIGGVALTIGQIRKGATEPLTEFAFLNFEDAVRVFGTSGTVNYAILTLAEGADPGRVEAAVSRSEERLGVFTRKEFSTSIRKEIDESFLPVIAVLTAIGFVVGAAVVGLTIYTATVERSREFGLLKAVGASELFLYRVVLEQSALVTGAGFLLGTLVSVAVANVAARAAPDFVTVFQLLDLAAVLAAVAVMTVVASLVPLRRLVSIEPASVFRV
jgi:putative ABC transport system permease protein